MANMTGNSLLSSCAPEIRNIIYGYALSYETALVRGEPKDANLISLSLLQVSKEVEVEAAPIFYGRNLFRFRCDDLEICHEQYLVDTNDHLRAEILSSYDDARMTCPNIGVPKRYIKSLRKVCLVRQVNDREPKSVWFMDRWVLDLENAITYLAARNVSLNELRINLERKDPGNIIRLHSDAAHLLRDLDVEKRISTAVAKFANLDLLLISKFRVGRRPLEPLKVRYGWMAAQPIVLNRVKVDHFARAQAVFGTSHAEFKSTSVFLKFYRCTERVLIHFKKMDGKGRKPVHPSDVECEGGDDGIGRYGRADIREVPSKT